MSTKRSVILSGVLAFAIAIAIIAGSIYAGILPSLTVTSTTNTSTTTYPSTTSSTVTSSQTATTTVTVTTTATGPTTTLQPTTTTNQVTTTTGTTTGASGGILTILLTDPPRVPLNVTAVYITYSNLEVHISNETSETKGWVDLKASGTIEVMGLVNVSQTISSVALENGTYNFLRFNITSAQVTYLGKNETAFVRTSMLNVPIIGGIEVNNSEPATAIIDMNPTVLNIGSRSNPEFVISAVANAYPVPSNGILPNVKIQKVGTRISLVGLSWWTHYRGVESEINITSASLSNDSLAITVENNENETTNLKMVIISALDFVVAPRNGGRTTTYVPEVFVGSKVFVIGSNGSLLTVLGYAEQQRQPSVQGDAQALFNVQGFNLPATSSKTFTYSGPTSLGFNLKQISGTIVPGKQYLVTVIGDTALASYIVVAH